MAVSFVGSQAWAAVTADAVVTLPASADGDRIYIIAGWKNFSVTAQISGWTEVTEFADDAIVAGNGTGSMKVAAWYLDRGASAPSNPTLDFSASPNIAGVTVHVIRKASNEVWDAPAFVTAAITNWTTTAQTVSASSAVDVPDGAIVVGAAIIRDDSATFTRPTTGIDAASGVTWNGNYVEHPATHLTTTTGFDMAADAGYRLVTIGGTGITLRQTATLSAAETGSALWIVQTASEAPTLIEGSDSGSGTDAVELAAAFDQSDSGTGDDTVSEAAALTASDTSTSVETATLELSFVGSDSGVGTDVAALEQGEDKNASDTGIGADNVTERALGLLDVGVGTDAAQAPSAAAAGSDSATGADVTSVLAREVADVGVGDEALGDRGMAGNDAGVGTDASSLQAGDNRQGTEVGAAVDSGELVVALSASDAGVGNDTIGAYTVALDVADSGAGADATPGVLFDQVASDAGTGVDTASVTTGVPVSPSTLLEIAIRDMLYAAAPTVALDESSAEPDTYRKNTLYLWEGSDKRRPQAVSQKRHAFEFTAVYAADDLGEEARMQDGDRRVSNALEVKLAAFLAAIRQNQHASEWSNLTVRIDPDFLASYGMRGFALRIAGYRVM
jgi:hypothetical protein